MTWIKSTGLRDKVKGFRGLATHAVYGITISAGDGTGAGGRDQVLDSGNGLAGFTVGEQLTIIGGTNGGVNDRILSVAAGAIELAAGTLTTESAGTGIVIVQSEGGCFLDCFKNGFMDLRSGAQPADADLVETGTLLVQMTRNGDGSTGVNFSDSGSLTAGKETDPVTGVDEVVKGTGLATAQAVTCWVYDENYTTGASTTAVRMVGTVGQTGADCNMPNGTTVTTSVDVDNTEVALTF